MNDEMKQPRKTTATLIYDGECKFCTRLAMRWRDRAMGRIDIVPYQDDDRPGLIPVSQLEEAVHLVDVDGRIRRGAEAVFRVMDIGGGGSLLWQLYRRIPLVRPVAEWFYRWVANNRPLVSRWYERLRRLRVSNRIEQ